MWDFGDQRAVFFPKLIVAFICVSLEIVLKWRICVQSIGI